MKVEGYVCLVVCLLTGAGAYGQLPNQANVTEFRGHLVDRGTASFSGLIVEVVNLRDRVIRWHADVASDGSFAFRALPEGDYQVRVLTLYEEEVTATITSIGPSSMPFEIRMPRDNQQKPVSGTISIQQLSHPPTRQVRKLLESGNKLMQEEHYNDAAERFREAARDAPDCVQAHANLGLALTRMGAWETAAEEFRAAVTLEPRDSLLHSNLAGTLAASNQFDEAEREARTALKLDPSNPRGHFVMAGILLRREAPIEEAVSHLVAAQDAIPSAKSAVEKICAANRVKSCP